MWTGLVWRAAHERFTPWPPTERRNVPDDQRSQLFRDFAAMLLATPVVVLVTLPLSEGVVPTILRGAIGFLIFVVAIYLGRRISRR
jgi:hypothetical protein